MPGRLVREVVVVTGASAGVGRATAREFARRGADVALLARGAARLQAAAREVGEAGGRALVAEVDVADASALEAAAERIEAELGPINVWVNNAFAGMFARFLDMTPEEFERVTQVTYLGQVNGTRAALKRMIPRNHGAVVLVGSALAYRGIPLQSAYCGAKHALQGFQDSIRAELFHARSRVNVSMVQLPAVNTPQFDWIRKRMPGAPRPVGPVYQPEVAARAIWFAAHARRKEVVVGAPALEAIVLDKVASPILDRYLARTAVEAQHDDSDLSLERPGNLFEPGFGDPGAHGRFDSQARDRSPQLWATQRRGWIAAVGVAAAATAAFGLSLRCRTAGLTR